MLVRVELDNQSRVRRARRSAYNRKQSSGLTAQLDSMVAAFPVAQSGAEHRESRLGGGSEVGGF